MKVDEREVFTGLEAGAFRAARFFGTEEVPRAGREEAETLLRVIERWPDEYHERFQGLFAEMYSIATSARIVNREPRLTHDQVQSYFAASADFFNSLKHR